MLISDSNEYSRVFGGILFEFWRFWKSREGAYLNSGQTKTFNIAKLSLTNLSDYLQLKQAGIKQFIVFICPSFDSSALRGDFAAGEFSNETPLNTGEFQTKSQRDF